MNSAIKARKTVPIVLYRGIRRRLVGTAVILENEIAGVIFPEMSDAPEVAGLVAENPSGSFSLGFSAPLPVSTTEGYELHILEYRITAAQGE